MLKTLRKRLTLICVAVTGIILIVMAATLLWISEDRADRQNATTFENNINSIVYKIQSSRIIDNGWLAQLETGNRLVVHLEDNQQPILFPGAWSPDTSRDILIQRVQEKALKSYNLDAKSKPLSAIEPESVVFEIDGDYGDRYQASVSLIPSSDGWQSLTLLRDLQGETAQKFLYRLAFIASIAAALLLLSGFSWWFSGWALKPIQENMRKQTEFVSAASHELRSPLAVIRASVSALIQSEDPEERERFAEASDRECARMARLIEDLLFLSRSDAGSWTVRCTSLEPDTLLMRLYDNYLPILREKQQTLTLELPDEILPPIEGDEQRLSQALAVLLDNACSYTPKKGSIRMGIRWMKPAENSVLRLAGHRQELQIFIADNGPGIPDAEKSKIYDRFYRSDPSRSKKNHYGLGLSISKEIVELHGGHILVRDSAEGGAEFMVCLPVLPETGQTIL